MTESPMKEKHKRLLLIIFIVYAIIICLHTTFNGGYGMGEAPTYMVTAASIINDGNAFISESDIDFASELFPEAKAAFKSFNGSGYSVAGGLVPWYFPTYSALCVPALLLFRAIGLWPAAAFSSTNLVLFLLLMLFIVWDPRLKPRQRWLLFFVLACHPSIFYIRAASAEMFQCVGVAFAALCWATGRKHRAALCIAVVGTTNPCALAMGLVMIAEYLINLFRQGEKGKRIRGFFSHWKEIILYGCCYLPGLVPFFYNYSICGHINLTAAHAGEWISLTDFTLLQYMWAYLTDWNFGWLPYMPILILLGVILLIPAVFRHCARYLWMWAAALGMLLGCSLMININCAMIGISRYGAWTSIPVAVAICTQLDALLQGVNYRRASIAILCSALYSAVLISWYNLPSSDIVDFRKPTPLAATVLTYAPELYCPIESTFVERASNLKRDKFIYYEVNGLIRKFYLSAADSERVNLSVSSGVPEDKNWLLSRLSTLTGAMEYINVPRNRILFIVDPDRTIPMEKFDIMNGTLTDGVLTTTENAGYAMLGPDETLTEGLYCATLLVDCVKMPEDAPAQFQVGINNPQDYKLLGSMVLTPDGKAEVVFRINKPTERINYRVYQNDGTILSIRGVSIQNIR